MTTLKTLICTTLISLTLNPFGASATPILELIVNNGQLFGAKNVAVNGGYYDVDFKDGTCAELYDGCDDVSDFIFQDFKSAADASISLLDTVLIDSSLGAFDSVSMLTNGCYIERLCNIITPFNFFIIPNVSSEVSTMWTENHYVPPYHPIKTRPIADSLIREAMQPGHQSRGAHTFAVWKTSIDVPEPSILMLLSLSIIGLAINRHTLLLLK